MQLTQFTDFGLRVLMYLGYRDRKELVTISEIADTFSTSRNHLTKVVNRLVKLGWVHATRGRNGGLKLSIEPELLGIGTIIKKLEAHESSIDCDKTPCPLTGNCHLKSMLDKGMLQYYQWMDQYTLADTLKDPSGNLIQQLHHANKL